MAKLDSNSLNKNNDAALVEIEVRDRDGGIVQTGSGVFVSRDGYILTADHLSPTPDQSAVAIYPPHSGSSYRIERRWNDVNSDLAIFRLPPTPNSCRRSVSLQPKRPETGAALVMKGFPGENMNVQPPFNVIQNDAEGFVLVDGTTGGNGSSGSPVFDADGQVVAIVHSDTQGGTRGNELSPVAPAVEGLRALGVDTSPGFCQSFVTFNVPANSSRSIDLGFLAQGNDFEICWIGTSQGFTELSSYRTDIALVQKVGATNGLRTGLVDSGKPCRVDGNPGTLLTAKAPANDRYQLFVKISDGANGIYGMIDSTFGYMVRLAIGQEPQAKIALHFDD